MNLKRTATIGVVGGALAAWLAAAATSGVHDVPKPPAANAAPIDTGGAALAAEIARLHERLRPTIGPRQPARNLFEFGSRAPRSARHAPAAIATSGATAAAGETAAVPAPPPAPPLKLSGIAEDAGPDGPIRTAIISGAHQLFLVKEGEMVTAQYRVATISADGVDLVDVDTNILLRLVLK